MGHRPLVFLRFWMTLFSLEKLSKRKGGRGQGERDMSRPSVSRTLIVCALLPHWARPLAYTSLGLRQRMEWTDT